MSDAEHYRNETGSTCSYDLPSLCTYWEIMRELVSGFFGDCNVWAEPRWLEDSISIFVIFITIFYLYVLAVIIYNLCELKSPFYICALSLAVGDLAILFTTLREGRVQTCVLRQIPARHYAWQTIGTFGMDCMLTNNLVMALTRFVAVYTIPRQEATWPVAIIGIFFSWIWAIAMTVCSHFGLMSHIWFENGDYKDAMKFPFQSIRQGILILCTIGTFFIYCGLMLVTLRIRFCVQRVDLQREMRMFAQCILIFICELGFLYATFWFGYHQLHLGDCAANAVVNFTVRPIAVGLTPVIYVLFSTKMRQLMREFTCPQGRAKAKRPTISSNNFFVAGNNFINNINDKNRSK